MRMLFVLALLGLIQLSYAQFQRPWENDSWVSSNPSIYTLGKSYWWNLPELHKTLGGANIEGAARLDSEPAVKENLAKAASGAEAAQNNLNDCTALVFLSLGYLPAFPSMALITLLSESSACMSYRENWISSVETSLLAAEYSIAAADRAVYDAREDFGRMRFAGLCDQGYHGPGSRNCAELSGAFDAVDNNISTGGYGKYALMAQHAEKLRRALASPTPDISSSTLIIGLAYGADGIVPSFRHAQNLSRLSVAQAEEGYLQGQKSIQSRKLLADKGIKELESQEIAAITRAPSGFDSGRAGSIRERYYSLVGQRRLMERMLSESIQVHENSGERGYLAKSMSGINDIDEEYSALLQDLETLRQDAERTVIEQKEEAETELSIAKKRLSANPPGHEAGDLFDEALRSFDSAESAASAGKRFRLYSDAAALARSSCNAGGFEGELEAKTSIESLKEIIALAEKDQINVVSEKEGLKLMPLLPLPLQITSANSAVEGITKKARLKYEDSLLEARKRIYDKLSLAGPGAEDLMYDCANIENGLIDGEGILLPAALGRLKKLGSDYHGLENTVDAYMDSIVGNAMSARANPLVSGVRLDAPAELVLDALMINPRPYNATEVSATIRMDYPAQFVYSDMVQGKEGVESVRSADAMKSIVLVFSYVGPFEAKRVIFKKESILAHTVSSSKSAEGLGGGRARVSGKTVFDLECPIGSFEPASGLENAQIDGLPALRPLSAGKHELVYDNTVHDAYGESIENIKAYRIGLNSKVEYDIRILPHMDLDSVPILLSSINDSRIGSFSVVCISGETLREKARISDTQYLAKVTGLKRDKESVLKVSYLIEDTESYVRERLSLLEMMNLTPSAGDLIGQARVQAASGNHTEALALIEKATAASEAQEKADAKLKERSDSLEKAIREELNLIDSALSRTNSSSTLIAKLSARKAELQRVLAESGSTNLSQKADALGKVDANWLGREMTSFKKEAYSSYNNLKERFYAAGNSSTPPEFLMFEEAFRKLETGGRLEYAVEALSALDCAEEAVNAQERSSMSVKNVRSGLFEDMKNRVGEVLERYQKQAAAAKGTDYSSQFTESEKKVETMIKDAQGAVDADPRQFDLRLESLNKSRERMEGVLSSLEGEAGAKLSMLESLIAAKSFAPERRAAFLGKTGSMRSMISSGEYINALRAGSAISKELDSEEEADGSGIIILGLTALAVLAAVGFYVSRAPKQKKELKKLTSFSGPAQQRHRQAGQEQPGRSSRNSPAPGHHRYSQPGDSKPENP